MQREIGRRIADQSSSEQTHSPPVYVSSECNAILSKPHLETDGDDDNRDEEEQNVLDEMAKPQNPVFQTLDYRVKTMNSIFY